MRFVMCHVELDGLLRARERQRSLGRVVRRREESAARVSRRDSARADSVEARRDAGLLTAVRAPFRSTQLHSIPFHHSTSTDLAGLLAAAAASSSSPPHARARRAFELKPPPRVHPGGATQPHHRLERGVVDLVVRTAPLNNDE